jgi:hypothetical protein
MMRNDEKGSPNGFFLKILTGLNAAKKRKAAFLRICLKEAE